MSKMLSYIKSQWKKNPKVTLILGIYLIIITLLPFSTFFGTWLGSSIGNDELIKSWKEILLIIATPITLWLLYEDKKLGKKILTRKINLAIIFYAFIHLVVVAWQQNDLTPTVVGFAFNLRFLVLFILGQIIIEKLDKTKIRKWTLQIVLATAGVVALFGALQVVVLPDDVLTNFGYSEETVKPFLSIDSNTDFVRINSTLRGPNPLGAYMMVTILLAIAAWIKYPHWRNRLLLASPLFLITVYGAQSRSAWLGLAIGGLFAAIVYSWNKPKLKRIVLAGLFTLIVALPIGWLAIRNTEFYSVNILHDDRTNIVKNTSDDARAIAQDRSIERIKDNPFGGGPGTNGHASNYSDDKQFAENYFIQITAEVGVIGLLTFLFITGVNMLNLWLQRTHPVPLAILAAFVGFLVINMFLHGWGDDTSAMILWGISGLYFGGYK